MKALVDDVLAREFSADLEFAWTPTETIDPEAQERMLASYTSRGILTLNEARAALGRGPLPDAAADTSMALTASGYVGLSPKDPMSPAKCAEASGGLGKTGDWDESRHPRKPVGAGDHQGGQFASTSESSSGSSQQTARSDTPADKEKVAEIIAICTKESQSTTVVDGLTIYWAEYKCLNGTTIERRQVGKKLPGFLTQP